jgi:hypothetical protein
MFVDLTVLIVSTIGLLLTPGRSSLWKLLFRDGIIFFLTAFFCNALAATVLLLDLNPAMNLMFSIPAACLTAGAAARSYIRLSNWSNQDVYVQLVQYDILPSQSLTLRVATRRIPVATASRLAKRACLTDTSLPTCLP